MAPEKSGVLFLQMGRGEYPETSLAGRIREKIGERPTRLGPAAVAACPDCGGGREKRREGSGCAASLIFRDEPPILTAYPGDLAAFANLRPDSKP